MWAATLSWAVKRSPQRSTSGWRGFETRRCRRRCRAPRDHLGSGGAELRPCRTRSCRHGRQSQNTPPPPSLTCSYRQNTHWPLSADVLRGDGVTADPRHLDVGDLLHLQTQVLPLNHHPRSPLPRSCQRINLQAKGREINHLSAVKQILLILPVRISFFSTFAQTFYRKQF